MGKRIKMNVLSVYGDYEFYGSYIDGEREVLWGGSIRSDAGKDKKIKKYYLD